MAKRRKRRLSLERRLQFSDTILNEFEVKMFREAYRLSKKRRVDYVS
jgi:hypothetical protein